VQSFWNSLNSKGNLNKGIHSGFYSSTEEAFVPKNEVLYDYVKKRHVHIKTGSIVETQEETNYLFTIGKYKEKLKKAWSDPTNSIKITEKFKPQVLAELKDLPDAMSVSRPAKRIPWGILIPNDKDQTVYVWLDALVNYYTALGYPKNNPEKDTIFQNMIHVLGKDIIRFHSLFWPAFLAANDFPFPKELIVHNFWLLKNVFFADIIIKDKNVKI